MILPPPTSQYDQENEAQTRVQITRHVDLLAASLPVRCLEATATWDPSSVADGAVATTTVTCLGAAPGDPVSVGFTSALTGTKLLWSAHVEDADVVRVVLLNKNGAAVDLGSGTLTVMVWKRR